MLVIVLLTSYTTGLFNRPPSKIENRQENASLLYDRVFQISDSGTCASVSTSVMYKVGFEIATTIA